MASRTKLETLRRLENDLAGELKRLRAVIKAAERGENRRIKNAASYLKRKGRELERVAKEQEKIQDQELTRLEKFLGESFESLTEARSAFQKQTRKTTKKEIQSEAQRLHSKAEQTSSEKQRRRYESEARRLEGKKRLSPSRNKYSIRQLSDEQKQTVLSFLRDEKSFNSIGQNWLQPNEKLGISVTYRYRGPDGRMHTGRAQGPVGRKVINSWSELYLYLQHYADNESENLDEWLGNIEIIRFPNATEQRISRAKQKDELIARHEKMREYYKEKEQKRIDKERAKQARIEARLARSERANRQLQAELSQERMK